MCKLLQILYKDKKLLVSNTLAYFAAILSGSVCLKLAIILIVVMLSVATLCVSMLSIVMLTVMLIIIILSDYGSDVFMLCVFIEECYCEEC